MSSNKASIGSTAPPHRRATRPARLPHHRENACESPIPCSMIPIAFSYPLLTDLSLNLAPCHTDPGVQITSTTTCSLKRPQLAAVGGSRFLKLLEPFCGLSPTSWAAPTCSPPGVAPADLGTFTSADALRICTMGGAAPLPRRGLVFCCSRKADAPSETVASLFCNSRLQDHVDD
jgi:hypothetical protein